MFSMDDRYAVGNKISDVFSRHASETQQILQRYEMRPNADGCMETVTPLSEEDQKAFIESRRFALSAVRAELPHILEQHPGFLTDTQRWANEHTHAQGYNGTVIKIDPKAKCYAYALAFSPQQRTSIHSHKVGCVSYVIQGEMMESEYTADNQPVQTTPKKAGTSTVASPHTEQSEINRHAIFSSGLHDQNLLLHVYDGYTLNENGTVEDVTGNLKKWKNAVCNDVYFPSPSGALSLR